MEDGAFFQNRNFGLSAATWHLAGTGEFDLV
jgi:hypothetical protein